MEPTENRPGVPNTPPDDMQPFTVPYTPSAPNPASPQGTSNPAASYTRTNIDIPVPGYSSAEQRRKRAMERQRRRRRNRIRLTIFCVIFLLIAAAIGAGIFFLVRALAGGGAKAPASASVPVSSMSQSGVADSALTVGGSLDATIGESVQAESVVQKERTWELLLANIDNALPESYDSEITLVTPFSNSQQQCDARIQDAITQMFSDASAAGYPLYFRSGYRSYATQDYLFNSMLADYKAQGMSDEDAYAATRALRNPPGTSEHQTGLAADIVPLSNPSANLVSSLEDTAELQWLHDHCAEYGFILRYPKDKTEITGTNYEPWHFRYVGVDAATEIMTNGWCLEEYIAHYFG